MPAIQFSGPVYTPELLKSINSLCASFGSQIEVRFYAHYRDVFDAENLIHLPDVERLSVDCLTAIENEERLWQLQSLTHLRLGIFEFDRPSFLGGFDLKKMSELVISETRKKNLDLEPLAGCQRLGRLSISGHTKNIETIATLSHLRELSLNQCPKKRELTFVNELSGLRSLSICLGGRESIDEIRHDHLEELRILQVRGLQTLGAIERFPSLRVLFVSDQLRLHRLSVAGSKLRELHIHNCKNLDELVGLDDLDELSQFTISRTALDLNPLLHRNWPVATEVVALGSKSQKWNSAARQILDSRGYREFPN